MPRVQIPEDFSLFDIAIELEKKSNLNSPSIYLTDTGLAPEFSYTLKILVNIAHTCFEA